MQPLSAIQVPSPRAARARETVIAPGGIRARSQTRPAFWRLGMMMMPLLLLTALLVIPTQAWSAESVTVTEAQLKAAMIPKLPLFVTWPDKAFSSPQAALRIGTLGEGPVATQLQAEAIGKKVGRRTVEVVACKTSEDALSCQIVVFVGSAPVQPALLVRIKEAGILTISDTPGFAESGGMIGLIAINRKIQLKVNSGCIKEAGLRVDPRLLQMATVIASTSPP